MKDDLTLPLWPEEEQPDVPAQTGTVQAPEVATTRRILVTGSRDWHDRARLYCVLDEVAEHHPNIVLVSGAARGADTLAEEWARSRGHQVETHPADWERYGNRAGYIRNAEMANLGADIVVAFRVGESRGTTMMMTLVQAKHLPLRLEQEDY